MQLRLSTIDTRWLTACALAFALLSETATAQTWLNSPVSRIQPGDAVNSSNGSPQISLDGRYIAFNSGANNVVTGQIDANETDVFLFDRQTNTMTLVSHAAGEPLRSSAPGFSQVKGIGVQGAVLFDSTAPFLIAGETAGFFANTYIHTASNGTNRLISHAAGMSGTRSNGECRGRALDPNGFLHVMACTSTNLQAGITDGNNAHDLYLYNSGTFQNTLITHAFGIATTASDLGVDAFNGRVVISDDRQHIAFQSRSTNLVDGVDTNNAEDVFVYDTQSGNIKLVSHISDQSDTGAAGATLVTVQNGVVIFNSTNSNHIPGVTDTNGVSDVFRYEIASGTITLVTHAVGAPLTAANGASTAAPGPAVDRLLIETTATNLRNGLSGAMTRDVLFWVRPGDTFQLVSHAAAGATVRANAASRAVTMAYGFRPIFESAATDLVAGFTASPTNASNLYAFNTGTAANKLLTHVHGQPSIGSARAVDLNSVRVDTFFGDDVVYASLAGDLSSSSDGNSTTDIYAYNYTENASTLISKAAFALATSADRQTTPVGISGDGRYVLQSSNATNLAFDQIETDNDVDVFVFDKDTGTQQLISFAIEGFEVRTNVPANAASVAKSISRDGNYILFTSAATNLSAFQNDTNATNDVFLSARTGGISVVSHASSGNNVAANAASTAIAVSADGGYVLWESNASNAVAGITDTNGLPDVFLYDRLNGVSVVVSRATGAATTANERSSAIALSPDGRYVLYQSRATNLIAGFVNLNGVGEDVYLFDRVAGTSRLVSRESGSAVRGANAGAAAAGLSDDGDRIAFNSSASNLIGTAATTGQSQVFLHQVSTSTNRLVSHGLASETELPNGSSTPFAISGNGAVVLFSSSSTGLVDGFVDGNGATNDIYRYDTATRVNTLFSRSNGSATQSSNREWHDVRINADASRIVFWTLASDVISGINTGAFFAQVYQYDSAAATMSLITHRDGAATEAQRSSSGPFMSTDGNRVAYNSDSQNLVAWTDLNEVRDAFIAQRINGFLVTPVINGNGSINPAGPQNVAPGATVVFTMTPGVGQRIVSASGCGGVLAGNQYTTAAVNADCTVTFNFAPQQLTLSYLADPHGSINGVTPQTVDYGGSGTQVTAQPDVGYDFDGWSDGQEFAGRTDVNVTANLTVTARFTIKRFNLLYSAGAGGTIDGQANRLFTVDYGADGPPVTAIPNAGQAFVRWSDGVMTAQRTDLDVTAHVTVQAEFAMSQNYTVTPSVGANGSIAPMGPQSVAPGGTTFFDLTPSSGYRIGSASGCNGALAGNRYTTGAVNANCNVNFTFNRTPVAQNGALDTVEDGGSYGGALSANDDDAFTVVLVASTTKGNLILQPNQQYFYTPNADASGPDSFSFKINDGVQDSNVATVTIQIAPVNDKPSFALNPAVVPEHPQGTSGAQTRSNILTAVDFGPADEDATQSIASVQAFETFDPSGIVSGVSVSNAGVLTYTLSGNAGLARVNVFVTDSGGSANGGQASSESQQLTISVRNATDLQVSDTNGAASVSPGQAVVYEVLVANAGPYATTGALLDVPVPAGLSDVLWSCNSIQLASCPQPNGNGAIVALALDLPSTGVLRFLVTGNVSAANGATLTHTAMIAATGAMQEVNAANNSATDADPVATAGVFIFGSGFEAASRVEVPIPEASVLYPETGD